MSFDKADIRAAVAAGIVTEAQAASLLALSESRRGVRAGLSPDDEPFELFKGFNEIFIVVGLTILYLGWLGVSGLAAFDRMLVEGGYIPIALTSMVAVGLLARYFTLKRRMIAPSIALAIMFAISAVQFGVSFGFALKLAFQPRIALAFGMATVLLVAYYALFRVPFTMALIALGSFLTAGSLFVISGARMPAWEDAFRLSADGPFAWLTIGMGLVALVVAMAFDMSDPHRVSRRSASGFWLHIMAAPAIVNTVAMTLLAEGTARAQGLLLGFLAVMAIFAIIIDRRSFLVAGVGYVVGIAITTFEDGAMLAILLLGLALVLLGAQWERLRAILLGALPGFPGKSRLPPWGGAGTSEPPAQ